MYKSHLAKRFIEFSSQQNNRQKNSKLNEQISIISWNVKDRTDALISKSQILQEVYVE